MKTLKTAALLLAGLCALPVVLPVLPLVCIVGGIVLAIWHSKTRREPEAGRKLLPVLKALAIILPGWMLTVLVVVAVQTNFLQHDFEGYGSMVAFFYGMPLAFGTTIVSWVALRRSRQQRFWIPLVVGLLPISACCLLLVSEFPWLLLVLAGLAGAGWLFAGLRKRTRTRRAAAPRRPLVAPAEPALSVTRPARAEPVAIPPSPPRVRNRRPVCGILAWVVPLLAVPIGILLGYLAGQGHYEGWDGLAILGWVFIPIAIALGFSLILAIASVLRRERYPWLAVTLLVLQAIALAFAVFDDLGLLVLVIAGLVLLATRLIWRHGRKWRALAHKYSASVTRGAWRWIGALRCRIAALVSIAAAHVQEVKNVLRQTQRRAAPSLATAAASGIGGEAHPGFTLSVKPRTGFIGPGQKLVTLASISAVTAILLYGIDLVVHNDFAAYDATKEGGYAAAGGVMFCVAAALGVLAGIAAFRRRLTKKS